MKLELFYAYINNTITNTKNILFIAAIFLAIRMYIYGMPESASYFIAGQILVLVSLSVIGLNYNFHRSIIRYRFVNNSNLLKAICITGLGKLLAALPLLIVMFWPFQSGAEFTHFYGYLFVFSVITLLPLASGAYFVLFVWDIAIYVIFALLISMYNMDIKEDLFAGVLIVLFAMLSLLTGRQMLSYTVELIKNKTALANANKAKADFLAVLSHEIKTPMTGILGMVDFLGETKTSEEQDECLDTITYCASTLLNTLNDVLDASKIDAGKFSIDKVNFDFHALLKSTIRIANQASIEKEIELSLVLDPSVPQYIYLDPNRLQQILLNLLNNSIKFTQEGKITLSVSFLEKPAGPFITVKCIDTGIGISDSHKKNIFKRFSQADSSISRKYGGTGLGLSISKHLVELMGGSIGFKSQEGKGSVFFFDIPYEITKEDVNISLRLDSDQSSVTPQRILLAEDNKINRLITVRVLGKDGHQVSCTEDGQQALKVVQEEEYDIVFMDIQMPIMDGISATKKIRALGDKYKKLPIIGLTANTNEHHLKEARNAGMNDFVFKPFQPGALRRSVIEWTGQNTTISPAPAAKYTNNMLRVLEEEFGSEYTEGLIKMMVKEITNILEIVLGLKESECKLLEQYVHDLKSLCGSMGMEHSYKSAEEIEKACIESHSDLAFSLLIELSTLVKEEIEKISAYRP